MFKPIKARQMTTPCNLYIAQSTQVNGALKKTYVLAENPRINVNFATYGGTEMIASGVYSVINTAKVVTWFRPDITSSCRIERLEDGAMFEVLGEPEDVEQRHQILSFTVKRLKGGA